MTSIFARWTSRVLPAVLLGLWLAPAARAAEPVSRRVLFLYSSWQDGGATALTLAASFQTVLDYVGMLPDYLDLNRQDLPGDAGMEQYRGVVVFMPVVPAAKLKAYLVWLDRQFGVGKRVVVLGHVGASATAQDDEEVVGLKDRNYLNLGLSHGHDHLIDQTRLRFVTKDAEGVEFERRYPDLPSVYDKFTPVGAGVRTLLAIERTDVPSSRSSVVTIGPAGGFAHAEFIRWVDPVSRKGQWYLNPFLFSREALGLHGLPVPDPTTLNGLRVAFSHVDGDGFAGASRIGERRLCSQVIADQVIRRYDFPTSVSVIVGQVDPAAAGSTRLVDLAREIFALPNVEPASHSYSHPLHWDPLLRGEEAGEAAGFRLPGYTYDPAREIDFSLEYITRELSPPGKPCRLFFWTGDCLPRESDIARCDALQCLNINGGDTVFDEFNASYSSVSPLYRRVGSRSQFFAGQANDSVMTNQWTTPKYGYRLITTTMERTGSPRRIKPIDIHYSFLSGEYPSSLQAVHDVHAWVRGQNVAPVFTSDYLRMVQGCLATGIARDGPGRYLIRGYGSCLTMRFDDESRQVDLARSRNVLGHSRQPEGLYVSLAPGGDEAVIVLDRSPAAAASATPGVVSATGWVRDFSGTGGRVRFTYEGHRPGRVELAGLPPSAVFAVTHPAAGGTGRRVSADDRGRIAIGDLAPGPVELLPQ